MASPALSTVGPLPTAAPPGLVHRRGAGSTKNTRDCELRELRRPKTANPRRPSLPRPRPTRGPVSRRSVGSVKNARDCELRELRRRKGAETGSLFPPSPSPRAASSASAAPAPRKRRETVNFVNFASAKAPSARGPWRVSGRRGGGARYSRWAGPRLRRSGRGRPGRRGSSPRFRSSGGSGGRRRSGRRLGRPFG